MTSSLTYDDLKALKPCARDFRRVTRLMGGAKKWDGRKISAKDGRKISAKAARKAGATFNDIVWAASVTARNDKDVERRLRLWLADCAAHVLHIYEADPKADGRPRDAIIAARQFARGKTSAAAVDAARAAAWAAEETWQFDSLIAWLGNKEPEDYPLPAKHSDNQRTAILMPLSGN